MKNVLLLTVPLIISLALGFGCNTLPAGGRKTNNVSNKELAEQQKIAKELEAITKEQKELERKIKTATTSASSPIIINIPNLIGKTRTKIKAILGKPSRIKKLKKGVRTGDLRYIYEDSEKLVEVDFRKGRINSIFYKYNSGIRFRSASELASKFGFDLEDVKPNTDRAGFKQYYKQIINGLYFDRVYIEGDKEEGNYYEILAASKVTPLLPK